MIILGIAFVVQCIALILFPLLGRRRGILFRAFFSKLLIPFSCWLWIYVASWIGEAFLPGLPWWKFRQVILVLAIAWFVWRVRKAAVRGYKDVAEPTQIEVMSKLTALAVWMFMILGLMHIWGVNYRALLAFGGFGALALGLAGQQVFSNFVSGCLIYATCPFKIGDRIDSPDRKLAGKVEHIGWYMTCLRVEGKPHYVPNSIFTSITIINLDREEIS